MSGDKKTVELKGQPEGKPEGDLEVREVLTEDILVDDEYCCRTSLNEDAIKRYESVLKAEREENLENGLEDKPSRLPPLEVALIDKVLVLFDGYHRLEAMKRAETESVMVRIHLGKTYVELPYLGATFNFAHGVPMSAKDIRKIVFKAYIKSKSNMDGKRFKSYREIRGDFGNCYSHNTFRKWTKEDFPSLFRAMSKLEPEGDIEFTPMNHDMAHLEKAKSYFSDIEKRFTAIQSEEHKAELVLACEETLEGLKKGFEVDYRLYSDENSEF